MPATDARISTALPQHPKTKKLIRRLGEGAAWYFVRLLLFATQSKPDGDLSGMTDEDLEIAVDWRGEPGAFISALAEVGFLDGEEGERSIHDWHEHNPWAAGSTARSARARFAALVAKHGRERAVEIMPDYAAQISGEAPQQRDMLDDVPAPSPGKAKPKGESRAVAMPAGFEPNDTHRRLAAEFNIALAPEFAKFCDFHRAKGSKFKDWDAALRTWLRNAIDFKNRSPAGAGRAQRKPPESLQQTRSELEEWAQTQTGGRNV